MHTACAVLPLCLTPLATQVLITSDRIADLEQRLKAVRLELLRITMNNVYHKSLRPGGEGGQALTTEK